MKTYKIELRYMDRRTGPGAGVSERIQASNHAVAVYRATKLFWKQLTRKQRFDVVRGGLDIIVRQVAVYKEAPKEVYAMVDRAIRSTR